MLHSNVVPPIVKVDKIMINLDKMYSPLQEAEYLFSIRSLLDERVRLCSGGSDRYATSRLSLPYHIQVYNFLPRKTAKLNLSSGQSKAPSKNFVLEFQKNHKFFLEKIGQHEELYNCVEPLSYPKPEITMTRPFKQSQSDCTNDDTRLRILATVTGKFFYNSR